MPHILHGVGIGLFICAGATSIGTIAATIAPQWQRICRLALGHVEPAFAGPILPGLVITSTRLGSST